MTINPAYQTKEVEYALDKVQCSAIVTPTSFKTQNYYNMLKEIAPELDHCHAGFLSCERFDKNYLFCIYIFYIRFVVTNLYLFICVLKAFPRQ